MRSAPPGEVSSPRPGEGGFLGEEGMSGGGDSRVGEAGGAQGQGWRMLRRSRRGGWAHPGRQRQVFSAPGAFLSSEAFSFPDLGECPWGEGGGTRPSVTCAFQSPGRASRRGLEPRIPRATVVTAIPCPSPDPEPRAAHEGGGTHQPLPAGPGQLHQRAERQEQQQVHQLSRQQAHSAPEGTSRGRIQAPGTKGGGQT